MAADKPTAEVERVIYPELGLSDTTIFLDAGDGNYHKITFQANHNCQEIFFRVNEDETWHEVKRNHKDTDEGVVVAKVGHETYVVLRLTEAGSFAAGEIEGRER